MNSGSCSQISSSCNCPIRIPFSEILASEQALHWGISPEVMRARDTRRDEEAQYIWRSRAACFARHPK